MTPLEYRKKHKKCRYCRWLRSSWIGAGNTAGSLDKCIAKDEVIAQINIPRPWCRCYEAKDVEEK